MVPIGTPQMNQIQAEYKNLKPQIDAAIQAVLNEGQFINGAQVHQFARSLETYLGVKHVITCANGTDALQIAMMALDLQPGDEVIVPAFTYVAPVEVIALLKLKVVFVDVDPDTFNIDVDKVRAAITPQTKAIVAVHLFGQCADMEHIMEIAAENNLYVIEDNAQSLGAKYTFKDGRQVSSGCIGHIGTTSFFPTKNLGCFGDGGAIMTQDDTLADRIKMIANHGQAEKYHHELVGVNSRLDTIQAAILQIKLPHLDENNKKRAEIAAKYDEVLNTVAGIETPKRSANSDHIFHQYTIKVKDGKRDAFRAKLADQGIQTMIYYPLPLHQQIAYSGVEPGLSLPVSESLCREVLSLSISPEMDIEGVKRLIV